MKQKEYQALHLTLLMLILYAILGIGFFIILTQVPLNINLKIVFAVAGGFYLIYKNSKVKNYYKAMLK